MAAFIWKDAKVGSLVYESFYPQNPGVIRKIISSQGGMADKVEVEWLKATGKRAKITIVRRGYVLRSFYSLIDEHERKAISFRKIEAKLRTM